jgi:quercetin dioxygenase-like cupin family protein
MTGHFGLFNMSVCVSLMPLSYRGRAVARQASRDLCYDADAIALGARRRESGMHVFSLQREQEWNPEKHVEKILGKVAGGDVTVACWEPGQISPYHCHPEATEIYFCFTGGGVMRTPAGEAEVTPGAFVVHPPGELHEYANGPQRTLLFRVRYGAGMDARFLEWRGHRGFAQSVTDAAYFRDHPPG